MSQLPGLTLTPGTAFGIYVHVPFCANICYYCGCNNHSCGN